MKHMRIVIALLGLTGGATLAWAFSLGPVAGVTGAPAIGVVGAEPTCNQVGCHAGNPLNSNGSVLIEGLPVVYTPGTTYNLTARLSSTATASDATRRWGFEITAVRLSDGQGAGTWIAPGLRLVPGGNSRQYVTHDGAALQGGSVSPVMWTFSWTSPATDEGSVGFYIAGNAANGNLIPTGDFIYTGADTAKSISTPVEPVTWGRLKSGKLISR